VPYISEFCNSTGTERLECLQALPADTLLNITNYVTTDYITAWLKVEDGIYVTNSSVDLASQGPDALNSVDFMAGFMPEEGQSLLGTALAPNASDFDAALVEVVGTQLAENVANSGLWNISDSFTPYNATINVYGDYLLTCPAETFINAAASSNAFPSMYVYEMQRAYGLSFYDPYELCTFPVGQSQPYYRCHSGDLYEVFGTYYIFDQPMRVPEDIYYTAMIQDMWGSFARTGNPNPPPEYLQARDYGTTLNVLREWQWPKYTSSKSVVASLEYPGLIITGLPDVKRCAILY